MEVVPYAGTSVVRSGGSSASGSVSGGSSPHIWLGRVHRLGALPAAKKKKVQDPNSKSGGAVFSPHTLLTTRPHITMAPSRQANGSQRPSEQELRDRNVRALNCIASHRN